jgi:hypothetical protein
MDKADLETLKAMRDGLIELAPFQSRRSDKDELYRRANIIANVIQFVEYATALLDATYGIKLERGMLLENIIRLERGTWGITNAGDHPVTDETFPTAIAAWKSLKEMGV